MVVPVGSHDLVHGHRRVFVVGVGPDHQRSPPHWVDGVEHDRMVPYEGHHVVWELLCCLDVGCEGSARTLEVQKKVKPQVSCFRRMLKQYKVNYMDSLLVIGLNALRLNMVFRKGAYWGLCLFLCIYLFLTSICDFFKDVPIFFKVCRRLKM